ncbi:MAG: copper resistance protein CopC [Gemmatimonadales bacterium]
MLFKSFLAVITAGALSSGFFHTALKSSTPAKDSKGASPLSVSLTFTEGVNAAVSAISILKSDSTEVAKLVVKPTKDDETIVAAVVKPLPVGAYIVRWRTSSDDGHAVRGAFAFSVTAAK